VTSARIRGSMWSASYSRSRRTRFRASEAVHRCDSLHGPECNIPAASARRDQELHLSNHRTSVRRTAAEAGSAIAASDLARAFVSTGTFREGLHPCLRRRHVSKEFDTLGEQSPILERIRSAWMSSRTFGSGCRTESRYGIRGDLEWRTDVSREPTSERSRAARSTVARRARRDRRGHSGGGSSHLHNLLRRSHVGQGPVR